ncbi:hypothetical protein [Candidatus Cytomitobacter primus]|nr:hypothetical protein [Candidatus Cytomitobacter primus]
MKQDAKRILTVLMMSGLSTAFIHSEDESIENSMNQLLTNDNS